ncbi:MAG: MarR family transcriptional regulator [Bacteroidota bacterium]
MVQDDILDHLVNDWQREQPHLDASAMQVVGRILQLGKKLEKRAGNALRDTGIYYTDLDVLATLRRSGKPYQLTPTQLYKSVLVTSGAMTALLDRLEKMNLIYRSPSPKDGRVKMAALTKEGVRVIDAAIKLRFQEALDAVAVFTSEEKEQLSNLLKKMLLHINK